MLLLGHAEKGRTLVEKERPRAGRALVEGEEIAHKGGMVQCPRGTTQNLESPTCSTRSSGGS